MNTSRKGTKLEYRVRDALEATGYDCTRAAASKGTWDIIAIHPTHIRLVQVKANTKPPKAEMETIREYRCPDCCSKEVWVYKDRVKEPIIEVIK